MLSKFIFKGNVIHEKELVDSRGFKCDRTFKIGDSIRLDDILYEITNRIFTIQGDHVSVMEYILKLVN